jgi:Amt family ammonium transporter
MGSLVLGLIVSPACLFFVSTVKNKIGYDDALDVFGIHCVGGVIGAIATGVLVSPALGGVGLTDYMAKPGSASPGDYVMATQVLIQVKAVLYTLLWSGVGSAILYKVVDLVVGLRVPLDAEREGLDVAEHGERAYNM